MCTKFDIYVFITDALHDALGYQLVGPFDILAGRHKGVMKNKHGKKPNFLLHWRYYYDPPEFMTVIKGDNSSQFHIGYLRYTHVLISIQSNYM